jgi:hypothetical protein
MMNDMNIALTLVFSVVMLLFMIYPAMVVTGWLEEKMGMDEKWHNPVMLSLVVLFSLLIGLFLRFA